MKYCNTGKWLIIFLDNRVIRIESSNSLYSEALRLLKNNELTKVEDMFNIDKRLREASSSHIRYIDNQIILDDEVINGELRSLLIERYYNMENLVPIVKMYKRGKANPKIERIICFITRNKLRITNDGEFIAYKAVRKNNRGELWDIYTYEQSTQCGMYRNDVGRVVSMPRNLVDSDDSNICSYGLNIGSLEYAINYGNKDNDVIVEVKIAPEDVISVTNEYHFPKLRVCKYQVLRSI